MADRDLSAGARARVLVLGGGPAGCAAALTLRRHIPGLAVSLVARESSDAPAVGETLSPGVLPLLDDLGLRAAFLAQRHLPCGGTASSWGGALVMERSYLFSGRAQGWHLDRAAFDAWLWERATRAGAHGTRARATRAQRVDGAWQVEFDAGAPLLADVVIDASGRQSWLAHHDDAAPRRDDALVADARWFEHGGAVDAPGDPGDGDAAAAFDPISSMGIGFALRSGMEAARVAIGMLEGEGDAIDAYAASIQRIYADYRARLAGIYALERRWPRAAFWRRRQQRERTP